MSIGVNAQIKKAERSINNNNFVIAAELYCEIVAKFPNNEKAKKGLSQLQQVFYGTKPDVAQQVEGFLNNANNIDANLLLNHAKTLLAQYPFLALVHNLCGVLYARYQNFEDAISSYQKAICFDPLFQDAKNNLANAYNNYGNLLVSEQHYDSALHNFSQAIELNNKFHEAYNNLANVFYIMGEKEKAKAAIRKALNIRPNFPEGLKNYSRMCSVEEQDPFFKSMKDMYEQQKLDPVQLSQLCFALGKSYEDQNEFDQAFSFFHKGNALKKEILSYDILEDEKMFQQILERTRELVQLSFKISPKGVTPIFVVGMPRSGTTLVEQILASHSDIYGAGELIYLNNKMSRTEGFIPEKVVDVLEGYLQHITKLADKRSFLVDKMPLNFRWTGFLLSIIPEAKIIDVRRSAIATCWSNFKHDFATGGNNFSHNLQDVSAYYKMYKNLMSEFSQLFPGQIITLDYENLTNTPEQEIEALFRKLNIKIERQCLTPHETKRNVHTASSGQVREKIYKGSSQQWKNYENHLTSLLKELDDNN
ncbi:MAG: sulfotransferase [Methylocystaceae bacterium]|nr:sulfotransferase [Methylocystaceae bacterium]